MLINPNESQIIETFSQKLITTNPIVSKVFEILTYDQIYDLGTYSKDYKFFF